MAVNRGKQFEQHIRKQFEKLDNTFVLRLYDVTMGYSKIDNPCDFIVFKDGTLNLFECKAIHGNTLNFKAHIRQNQWDKMLKYTMLVGVNAGILVWFIDHDITLFLDIYDLNDYRNKGYKSFNIISDIFSVPSVGIKGKKKKTFFEYDLEKLLEAIRYEK